MSIHQRLAVCQTCLKSSSSFTKKLRLGVEPGSNAYNLEECLICSQRARATRQQQEAEAQTQVRQRGQPRRLFSKDGAAGADGAEHEHSLDLNAAVAAVKAPPAEPSGEPSGEAAPSGLLPPRVLAGSPSDIADELGCEFRRGQRVVRALLDETGTQTAMSGRDGLLPPPMPPTPGPTPGLLGSTRSMRHPVGGRDECGRLRPPGSDGSMRSDSSSPPSGPRSLPAAPPPAPGAGKLAVRRVAAAVDISMLTSGLRGVSLGKRTLDQRA